MNSTQRSFEIRVCRTFCWLVNQKFLEISECTLHLEMLVRSFSSLVLVLFKWQKHAKIMTSEDKKDFDFFFKSIFFCFESWVSSYLALKSLSFLFFIFLFFFLFLLFLFHFLFFKMTQFSVNAWPADLNNKLRPERFKSITIKCWTK